LHARRMEAVETVTVGAQATMAGSQHASARGRPRERASRGESRSSASSRRQRARTTVWRSAPGDMSTCVHLSRHRGSKEACRRALRGDNSALMETRTVVGEPSGQDRRHVGHTVAATASVGTWPGRQYARVVIAWLQTVSHTYFKAKQRSPTFTIVVKPILLA
jgi:hypothetical protein